jgi:hypothetical protein
MISVPRHNMIRHTPSRAFTAPFNIQAKAATPKLRAKSALAGPGRSPRVTGKLHLPDLVRPR